MSLFIFYILFFFAIFDWNYVNGSRLFDLTKVHNRNYEFLHLKHPNFQHGNTKYVNREKSLQFSFNSFGFDYDIQLFMNTELFHPNYKHYVYRDDAYVEVPSSIDITNHCFYHGHVERTNASNVAVSTCNGGLQGVIQTEHADLLIYPVHQTNALSLNSFQPSSDPDAVGHVIFPYAAVDHPSGSCGVSHDDPDLHYHDEQLQGKLPKPLNAGGRRLLQTNKWLELLLVNDKARYTLMGSDTEVTEQTSADYANIADSYYDKSALSPPIRIVLTGQVTFEVSDPYTPAYNIDNQVITSNLLQNKFLPWATYVYNDYPTLAPHDSHVLISGLDFEDPILGLAIVGGMCVTTQSGAIVEARSGYTEAFVASVVAHEVGHTLNMIHDEKTNPPCSPPCDKIMCSTANPNAVATRFSTCSMSAYSSWIASSGRKCLDNIPTFVWGPSVCGNGIIEGMEQCDCGNATVDPCCQCAACRLKSGSAFQCSNQQPCCSNCQIIPKANQLVCRPSINADCDSIEYCDGQTGACPKDTFAKAGKKCTASPDQGVCYQGACKSWNPRCRAVNAAYSGCANQTYNGAAICSLQFCTDTSAATVPETCFPIPASPPNASAAYADNGVSCGSTKQCYNGSCVASTQLYNEVLGDDESLFDKLKGLSLQEILTYVAIALLGFSLLSCLARCCSSKERRTYYIERVSSVRNMRGGRQGAPRRQPAPSSSVATISMASVPLQPRAEGALPPGWVQGYTSDGRPYWFNQTTGVTSWEYPQY